MTNKEALEIIQKLKGAIGRNIFFMERETYRKVDAALNTAINSLSQKEWITVGERLPEEGEVVLITNAKGNVRCGQYRGCAFTNDDRKWVWKGNTVETVIAWMPLPESKR